MGNFYEYLEHNHPEFHQDLLNEIDMKYWMGKAAEKLGGVGKVSKIALQNMALRLALAAAGTSAVAGGATQAQERPYDYDQYPAKPSVTMQKPADEVNPLLGRAKAMLGKDNKIEVKDNKIEVKEVKEKRKKNPKTNKISEITFVVQIPTYREVSKFSKQDYDPTITIKNEIKKIFLKKEFQDLGLNPYLIKSASINDEMLGGSRFDIIKKLLNTADNFMYNSVYKKYIDQKQFPKDEKNDKQKMIITLIF